MYIFLRYCVHICVLWYCVVLYIGKMPGANEIKPTDEQPFRLQWLNSCYQQTLLPDAPWHGVSIDGISVIHERRETIWAHKYIMHVKAYNRCFIICVNENKEDMLVVFKEMTGRPLLILNPADHKICLYRFRLKVRWQKCWRSGLRSSSSIQRDEKPY